MKRIRLDKKDKKLAIIIFIAFIVIAAIFSGSSFYLNYRESVGIGHTEKAYLNRYNVGKSDSKDHEAVTDINGETPNQFAEKVQEANVDDTGTSDKVLVNSAEGKEDDLAALVSDKNAISYDTYTIVRFENQDDKQLFVKNLASSSNYSYQDDGKVQIAGLSGVSLKDESTESAGKALTASDTPAKDAHDQGKLLVAVIDTGCGDEADSSVNFTTDGDSDANGHGTYIAKTIKEKANGKAYIMSLKAINDNGEGDVSNVAAAVKYAIAQGVDIINMSIIAKDNGDGNMNVLRSVVTDAVSHNIRVVAAAGNYSDDISNYVPAGISGVISVGVVDDSGMIAGFSNYGKSLTMSVKDADSTSQAAAIVSGYLASGKRLGSQSDIAGNYTENPKNSGKDTPEENSSKFKVQIRFAQSMFLHVTGKGSASITIDDGHDASASQYSDGFISSDAFTDEVDNSGRYWYPSTSIAGAWFTAVTPDYGYHFFTVTFENPVGTHNARETHTNGANENSTYNRATYYPDAGTYDFVLCGENDGWSGTLGGAPARGTDSGYVPDTDGKLTVNFVPNSGTYVFNGNGGTAKEAAVVVTYDSQINNDRATYVPTRNGYTFAGWYTDPSGGVQVYDANGIATNGTGYWNNGYATWPTTNGATQTLYAHWNIAFGWTDTNFEYVTTDANDNIISHKTAYYWQRNPLEFTDTARPEGDTVNGNVVTISPSDSLYNDTIHFTASPDKSGGTSTNVIDYNKPVNIGTSFTFKDITLPNGYMLYNGQNVFFYVQGSEGYNETAGTGNTGNYAAAPMYLSPSSNGVYAGFTQTMNTTAGMNIIIRVRGVKYNVHFDSNATGTMKRDGITQDAQTVMPQGTMDDQTMQYGNKETIKNNGFTWEGHTFLGWSTNPEATAPDSPYVYVSTGNKQNVKMTSGASAFWDGFGQLKNQHEDGATVTLYAVWKTNDTTVTVKPNGGSWNNSTSDQQRTQKWGTALNLGNATPDDLKTTINYDFNCTGASWESKQPTGVSSSATSSNKDISQLAFYRWRIEDHQSEIELDPSNGSWGYFRSTAPYTYIFGANEANIAAEYYFSNVVLPLPKRDGYTFLGWYTNSDCTKKAGNSGAVYNAPSTDKSSSITLYARWRKNSFSWNDTLEYNMVDDKYINPPAVKIRKTDDSGNVLTSVDGEGFIIDIAEGTTFDTKNIVLELDTSTGVYDYKTGKLLVSNSSTGYDKNLGWYDISDYLEDGKSYVARETIAPHGYTYDTDKPFTVKGTKESLAKANQALAAAEKALKSVKSTDELSKAKVAYDAALKAVETAKDSYITVTFVDSSIPITPPPHFKTDSSGRPLQDAEFELIDLTDNNKIVGTGYKTDENGNLPDKAYSDMIAGHKMQLKETNPPEGYKATSVTFTVPKYATTKMSLAEAIDNPNYVNVQIIKKDSSDNTLKGAEFKLYTKTKNGTLVECRRIQGDYKILTPDLKDYTNASAKPVTAVSGSDGIAKFMNIPTRAAFDGDTSNEETKYYYIVETKAPNGYSISADPVKVLLPDEDGKTVTYTIVDNKVTKYVLSTGGHGTEMFIGSGIVAISAAIVIAIIAKASKH